MKDPCPHALIKAKPQAALAREQVYQTIAAIPYGKVASYGQLATLAGQTGAARWVGWCLRQLPKNSNLPWHRVMTASGQLAFPYASKGYVTQRTKLEQEGVSFNRHQVSMKLYQWQP